MKKEFNLSISTPNGKNFVIDNVKIINIEIGNGRIGIMPNHVPIVSVIKPCCFSVEFGTKKREGIINAGLLNFSDNSLILLTNDFVWKEEISKSNVENEIKRIEYSLKNAKTKEEEKILNERMKYFLLQRDSFKN